jgi:glycosyltransferase involved in cell wall biosynthesis
MPARRRIAILMPSYNERPETVRRTLMGLHAVAASLGGLVVYLVDDGSRTPLHLGDHAADVVTDSLGVVVARHPINLGQGAALETARQLAVRAEHDLFVTMDVDGQHRADDLPALVKAIDDGADVAFGNRFAADTQIPFVRGLVLRAARIFERVITGLKLNDAHNGYRAFSRKGIELLSIRQNRMAHATEIKQQVALHKSALRITEVPVSVLYSEDTMQRGQSSLGAVDILRDLAHRFLFGPNA